MEENDKENILVRLFADGHITEEELDVLIGDYPDTQSGGQDPDSPPPITTIPINIYFNLPPIPAWVMSNTWRNKMN